MVSRVRSWVVLGLAISLVASACGQATPTPAAAGAGAEGTPQVLVITATPEPEVAPGSIQISGAGATFPFPLYSRWFYQYAFIDSSVMFNYQSIGSGGGIQQITQRTVDFGASDAILNADQLAAAPGLQMFPTVAGAVVPTYNVAELADQPALVLDSDTLGRIFLGTITRWNDPAIAALNPGLPLPNRDIIVVHRSDGSGTSYIFTDYLSSVSSDWANTVGKGTSVQWPVGLGGKGNEGVAGTVLQNDGSIGYVELAYAVQNHLAVAHMVNAAGNTVEASIASIQNAMADFGTEMPDTLARSIVNAPGADSWPIAGYTYLLIYMDQTDCTKAQRLIQFIHWAQTEGQSYAQDLLYAPLPDAVRDLVFARLDQITCQGAPLAQ
jgi:phosphate transport system substrate-binding protein